MPGSKQENNSSHVHPWGDEAGGVRMSIRALKQHYSPGESITVVVTLKCSRIEDVEIGNLRVPQAYDLDVRLSSRERAPITLFGKHYEQGIPAQMSVSCLTSGQTAAIEIKQVNRRFDMSLSDDYSISVSRRIANANDAGSIDTARVVSNTIRVTIDTQ